MSGTEWFCGVQLGGVKLPAEFPAARNSKSMVHAGTGRWRQKNGRPMLIVGSRLAVYRMAVVTVTMGVIDLTLPPLPEEEYPLPVRSICLILLKTLYCLPPLFAEDGRGLRTAIISKWQPQKNTALTCNDYVAILLET